MDERSRKESGKGTPMCRTPADLDFHGALFGPVHWLSYFFASSAIECSQPILNFQALDEKARMQAGIFACQTCITRRLDAGKARCKPCISMQNQLSVGQAAHVRRSKIPETRHASRRI